MIRSLRKLHRGAFAGIAVVVPIVMFTAVAGRAPRPGASALMVDVPAADSHSTVLLESAGLWRSVAIVTRVLASERGGYEVELLAGEINGQADLLLYWSGEATPGRLPAGSRLLGPYGGGTQRFAVPADADPREGMLILYSLGHGPFCDSGGPEHWGLNTEPFVGRQRKYATTACWPCRWDSTSPCLPVGAAVNPNEARRNTLDPRLGDRRVPAVARDSFDWPAVPSRPAISSVALQPAPHGRRDVRTGIGTRSFQHGPVSRPEQCQPAGESAREQHAGSAA